MQVAELDAPQHLPEDAPHRVLVKAVRILLKVVQHRVVDELEDEVEASLAPEDLDQVYQVLVPQLLQVECNRPLNSGLRHKRSGPIKSKGPFNMHLSAKDLSAIDLFSTDLSDIKLLTMDYSAKKTFFLQTFQISSFCL